jgi:chloramphenicol 3-O-phosphotransferase
MNLFIFGASCSGKSTLARALQERLGQEWVYLDRDDLLEKEGIEENAANQEIDRRLNSLVYHVIDAQIPWREPKKNERYVRVFCPIENLFKRDEMRNEKMQRPEARASRARKYVYNTHQSLEKCNIHFDLILDSSRLTVEQEVEMIFNRCVS